MRIVSSNVDELRERFFEFYDGVVCSVRISLRPEPMVCEIVVHAMDSRSDSGWSAVRFVVRDLVDFRFQIGRHTFEVLSGGIQFGWRNGAICVVLDAYPDDGPGLPDLTTNSAFVIGATCDVEIEALPVVGLPS